MFFIPELWEIIKSFLIRPPSEKSLPPYNWIFIKNFMLQGYWMKKYDMVVKEIPRWEEFYLTQTCEESKNPFYVISTATYPIQFKKEFQRSHRPSQSNIKYDSFKIEDFSRTTNTIVVYSIYNRHVLNDNWTINNKNK
jgi:hypothetical protein